MLPPGKDVVFKLRSQGQPEFVLNNRELILDEHAVNVLGLMMWEKIYRGHGLDNVAWTPSRSESPDNFISPVQGEVMDGIDVKSVASLFQLRPEPIGPIEVSLNLEIGRVTECMVPAAKQIAARYELGSVDRLLHGRRIERYVEPLSDAP